MCLWVLREGSSVCDFSCDLTGKQHLACLWGQAPQLETLRVTRWGLDSRPSELDNHPVKFWLAGSHGSVLYVTSVSLSLSTNMFDPV